MSEKEAVKSPEIKGNTLRVYLHVLRRGPCELGEVQRGLSLSSPSLASYHLNKLVEAGYVVQDGPGRYVAVKDTAADALAGYSKIGAAIVPQTLFFALLFTILVAFFGYESLYVPSFIVYLVIISSAAVAALWYETARLWRRLATWA